MNVGVFWKKTGDLAVFLQRPVPLAGLGVIVGGLEKVTLVNVHGLLSKN
jgi:hypothetical protein